VGAICHPDCDGKHPLFSVDKIEMLRRIWIADRNILIL